MMFPIWKRFHFCYNISIHQQKPNFNRFFDYFFSFFRFSQNQTGLRKGVPFARYILDVQQIGVDLQSAVGIVSQNLLGQNLTQLDAFLVEGVDVPGKALIHDLVLEVGQQSAHSGGSQLLTDDDGAGTAAGKLLVVIGIVLAAGEGHDLSGNVGAQLLLAGGALDHNVRAHLAVAEANELQGGDVGALVQQLIEGVLTVGAGLAEDNGTGLF